MQWAPMQMQMQMHPAPMQIHELDSYHTITHGAFARAVSLQWGPMQMQIHFALMMMHESGSYHRSTLFSIQPPLFPRLLQPCVEKIFLFLFFVVYRTNNLFPSGA